MSCQTGTSYFVELNFHSDTLLLFLAPTLVVTQREQISLFCICLRIFGVIVVLYTLGQAMKARFYLPKTFSHHAITDHFLVTVGDSSRRLVDGRYNS